MLIPNEKTRGGLDYSRQSFRLRQRMDFEMEHTTFDDPDFYNMMDFTNGRWKTMNDEEQEAAIHDFRVWLPKRRAEMHQERLRLRWEQLCPPIYRESVSGLLPNLPMFEEVQKWEYGPTGLLLIGSTRRGKTRAIWALLKRLHFQEERKILAFNPMDLKLAVANAWRDRVEDQEETNLIIRLRRARLLFLDDLDTIKFTEAVEETIYDIFEYRQTHEKPVIVTVNQGGEQLADRLNSNGRGAKIVERIRESCRVINFGEDVKVLSSGPAG